MLNQDRLQRIQEERARRVGGEPAGYSGQDFNVNVDRIRQERQDRLTAIWEAEQAKKQPVGEKKTEPTPPSEDPKNSHWWEKTKAFLKQSPNEFMSNVGTKVAQKVDTFREETRPRVEDYFNRLEKGTPEEKAKQIGGTLSDVQQFAGDVLMGKTEEEKKLDEEYASGKITKEEYANKLNLGGTAFNVMSNVISGGEGELVKSVAKTKSEKVISSLLKGKVADEELEGLSKILKNVSKKEDVAKIISEATPYTAPEAKFASDITDYGARQAMEAEQAKTIKANEQIAKERNVESLRQDLAENPEILKKKEISGITDPIEQQNKRLQIMDQIKKEKPEVDIPPRVEIPPERAKAIEESFPNADNDFKVKASTAIDAVKTDVNVKDNMRQWLKNSYSGKAAAQREAVTFKIPESAENLVKHEAGETYVGRELVESKFDELLQRAEDAGIKVEKRQNYIPHVYNETPEEIAKAVSQAMEKKGVPENIIKEYLDGKELPAELANTLRMNPFFTQERAFRTYAEAAEYGLTPKYKTMSQLVGHYTEKLNDVIANNKLVDDMVRDGNLSTTGGGGKIPVNLPGKEGLYYAQPKTAGYLNDYFRNEGALNVLQIGAKYGAKFSKGLQNIVLAGGVPGTNFNFFTFGHVIKSLSTGVGSIATGDLRGALTDFKSLSNLVRSNFTGQSIKWFNKRAENGIMGKMANKGINMTHIVGNYKETNRGFINFFKNTKAKKLFGETYDKLLQEKTFNSFLSMQTVSVFEDTYKTALKSGLPEEVAVDLAGDTTKTFMGLIDNVKGKTTEDTLSTVFFAPQFREGIINTYWNTLKSLSPTTWTNPAFKKNRKLAIGMAITFFGGYDMLNQKLNGHHIWENPDGKELELMIPGENGKVYYVPFMPSQLAFFRNTFEAGKAMIKGDEKTAVQKAGSNLSMGIKLLTDVIGNKDYFGNEIYDNQAPRSEKYADIAKYIGMNANHPFVKGAWQQMINSNAEKQPIYPAYEKVSKLIDEGKREEAQTIVDLMSKEDKLAYEEIKKQKVKPVTQVLSEMMEVPVRFSSVGKIKSQEYYKKIDEITRDVKSVPLVDRTEKIQEYMSAAPEAERRGLLYALGKADIDTEGVSISEDIIRTKPTYNKIKELLSAGNTAEAKKVLKGLSKEDIESFKKVKASEQAKKTKRSKLEMQPVFDEIKSLVQQGRTAEAKQILRGMNEEELRIFKLLKENS